MEPLNQSLLDAAKLGEMWLAKWIADQDDTENTLKVRAQKHLERIQSAIAKAS